MSNEAMILKSDAGGRMLLPVERQVELVREFERSGLSGPRFAAIAGLKYQTFATWRRKHGTLPATRRRPRVPPPGFGAGMEAVVVTVTMVTMARTCELRWPRSRKHAQQLSGRWRRSRG